MSTVKSEWYVVVNPHAGSGKTIAEWAKAESRLLELGIGYVTRFTERTGHAVIIAREAAAEGYRRILAVGGDGSVHEVLNGIVQFCHDTATPTEEFYLAVIPIGSGNDWIKSLNVPHDTEKVVSLVAQGSFRKQDVVQVALPSGTHTMANIGGVGFDSHVCVIVNTLKDQGKRSRFIYVAALLKTILTLKSFDAEIVGDGKLIYSGTCYSVAFGNGKYSGGGLRQTPLSQIDDGLLDVMVVPKISLLAIAREVVKIFNGNIHKSRYIHYSQCHHLQMKPLAGSAPDLLEIDGEVIGKIPVEIKLGTEQINVLVGQIL